MRRYRATSRCDITRRFNDCRSTGRSAQPGRTIAGTRDTDNVISAVNNRRFTRVSPVSVTPGGEYRAGGGGSEVYLSREAKGDSVARAPIQSIVEPRDRSITNQMGLWPVKRSFYPRYFSLFRPNPDYLLTVPGCTYAGHRLKFRERWRTFDPEGY